MGTGITFELLKSGCPGGLERCNAPHLAFLEGKGWAHCGQCSKEGGCGRTCSRAPPQPSPRGASTTTINTSSCSGRIEGCRQKQQESNLLSQLLFSQQKGRGSWKARLESGLPVCGLGGRDGMGVPAAGAGAALHLSPATAPGSPFLPPHSPRLQPLSPSPLLLYLRICRWNSNELSILWLPHFPTEGQCLPDAGSGRNSARRKGKSKRMLFSSFYSSPPPYFILCVCVCVGCTLHWLSPPRPPPPRFHLLGPALAPFMLHDSSNGSPGGSYRECIGSLGERKPPTSYTPDV